MTDLNKKRLRASVAYLLLLSGLAEKHSEIVEAHIKIDTGMGRYGFAPEETDRVAQIYRFMKRISITGLYTHFNCAYNNSKLTKKEFAVFTEVVQNLQQLCVLHP